MLNRVWRTLLTLRRKETSEYVGYNVCQVNLQHKEGFGNCVAERREEWEGERKEEKGGGWREKGRREEGRKGGGRKEEGRREEKGKS